MLFQFGPSCDFKRLPFTWCITSFILKLHLLCKKKSLLIGFHVVISFFFPNSQHKTVWNSCRIAVGSTAEIVKLTYYKWICNPPVDLNCVYCHSRMCMLFFSVSAQLHLFPSLTSLSVLAAFFMMPQIHLQTVYRSAQPSM